MLPGVSTFLRACFLRVCACVEAELHAATHAADEARDEGRKFEKEALALSRALESAKQERAEVSPRRCLLTALLALVPTYIYICIYSFFLSFEAPLTCTTHQCVCVCVCTACVRSWRSCA